MIIVAAAGVVLLLLILYALHTLVRAVDRVEKATRRVARILDRPRKDRAALEEEADMIGRAASAGAASAKDMQRLDEIEEKLRQL